MMSFALDFDVIYLKSLLRHLQLFFAFVFIIMLKALAAEQIEQSLCFVVFFCSAYFQPISCLSLSDECESL